MSTNGNDWNFPDVNDPIVPSVSEQVRILMLVDEDLSFSKDQGFGLSELITTLENTLGVFVSFLVTKAHRQEGNRFTKDADIEGFLFDNPQHFNPKDYDQIWFLGQKKADPVTQLSDKELRIVSKFMDDGGGVFATGDHEDLGAALCSQVPRVRSMRKWHWDSTITYESYENFDPKSGDSPPVKGSFRLDTLVATSGDGVPLFDNQSDDVPAPIIPKKYDSGNMYFSYYYPHPLLCGPKGIIRVLPDHMHEGECIVPQQLDLETTFDGYTSPEYPSFMGEQVVPDIIAEGVVTKHATDNTGEDVFPAFKIVDVQAKQRDFGAIGVYDGHAMGVGRVVVDSTFHHFININLVGTEASRPGPSLFLPGASKSPKYMGFKASDAGKEHYVQIKAYFRNIGIWLCRPAIQMAMFQRILWAARWDSQLRMRTPRFGDLRATWNDVIAYGWDVRSTMSRLSLECIVIDSAFEVFDPLYRFSWWLKFKSADPPPEALRHVIIGPEELLTVALAGIMSDLVEATPTRDTNFLEHFDENMRHIISTGVARTLDAASIEFDQRAVQQKRFLSKLQRGSK